MSEVARSADSIQSTIQTSAPGRICLFGEHQDYLGLPVIACAINLRVEVNASAKRGGDIRVHLPDTQESFAFDPNAEFTYRHDRDYLPAAANILRREGLSWSNGWDVTIAGTIPLNSGASSSSALQVAWCSFLLAAAGDPRAEDPLEVARYAHCSEVTEFGAPGGMMDHYSSAIGGTIWLDCGHLPNFQKLPPCPGEFVLVDSEIPKDTNGVLGTVRARAERINIDYRTLPAMNDGEYEKLLGTLKPDLRGVLGANRENALLTETARRHLMNKCTPEQVAALLTRHHHQLSANLGVSLPEIDALIEFGISRGALGGKINGSGSGGSFYLLCSGNGAAVRQSFLEAGYRAFLIKAGPGLDCRVQSPDRSLS